MATYDTSRYDALYDEYVKQQQASAAKQKTETTDEYNKQLKAAYINRMQNQKTLNENLAKAGIRGGATETSNLKLMADYQNTTNSLNEQKTKALQDIDDSANANILSYKQQNDAAKISYIEQREAEDRQIAQTKAENEAAAAAAAQSDLWTAKYGGYTDTSKLKDAYAAAATTEEKAIIQARINYLNEQAATKKEEAAAEKESDKEALWTAKYGGWYNITNLNKAYKKAKTTAEKTIIKNRINYLKAQTKGY